MPRRHTRYASAAMLVLVVVAATATALVVRADPPEQGVSGAPQLEADVVQLRTDELLRQLQVSVTNTGDQPIVVESVLLTVPGFASGRPIPKDSPIAPGQTVDLSMKYGDPRCGAGESPAAGRPSVRLRMRPGDRPAVEVSLTPGDPTRVLDRILARECLARRLARVVEVRFGPDWRREGKGNDVRLHGTLEVRLLETGTPRELTQIAGTVIYALAPEGSTSPPLARLDGGRPSSSIAVVVSVSRCDGHARGEAKKPYDFTAWLAEPGGAEQPVAVAVTAADKAALRVVCPM